jgi:hypothetical protein
LGFTNASTTHTDRLGFRAAVASVVDLDRWVLP